jgi:hypothetical protein
MRRAPGAHTGRRFVPGVYIFSYTNIFQTVDQSTLAHTVKRRGRQAEPLVTAK